MVDTAAQKKTENTMKGCHDFSDFKHMVIIQKQNFCLIQSQSKGVNHLFAGIVCIVVVWTDEKQEQSAHAAALNEHIYLDITSVLFFRIENQLEHSHPKYTKGRQHGVFFLMCNNLFTRVAALKYCT